MKVQVLGCSHHSAPISVREQLAFAPDQARSALDELRSTYPGVEAVLLSTCNRVELYLACENDGHPSGQEAVEFFAHFHGLRPLEIMGHLYERAGPEAVRHLFVVASSLDSMVVGEPQILAQVKQAYELAMRQKATGPLTNAVFQAAVRVARRVANETAIHQRKVSIPSLAVADFAQQIFDRFDNKQTLVIGAGEMAAETLKYLRDQGARQIVVVNRSAPRAVELARQWNGRALAWDHLMAAIAEADLVISTTGAAQPIVTLRQFADIERLRCGRPLFILDLAVPRDFEPAIGSRPGVYLYAIDDLQEVCERNRKERDKELPVAMRIIDEETARFVGDMNHRVVGPIVRRLREGWQKPKDIELERLFQRLPELDESARQQVRQSFDRLLGKLLHPPMESLRNESRQGIPHTLLDALATLFRLKD
jgi:glutamyl-tRNA reductase